MKFLLERYLARGARYQLLAVAAMIGLISVTAGPVRSHSERHTFWSWGGRSGQGSSSGLGQSGDVDRDYGCFRNHADPLNGSRRVGGVCLGKGGPSSNLRRRLGHLVEREQVRIEKMVDLFAGGKLSCQKG